MKRTFINKASAKSSNYGRLPAGLTGREEWKTKVLPNIPFFHSSIYYRNVVVTGFLFILFFTISLSSNAQYYNPFQPYYPHSKNLAGAYAEYTIGSNSITADMVNSLFLGKYLTTAMKNEVTSKLKNMNNAGGDANAVVFYSYRPDTSAKGKNVGFWFSVKSRNHADTRFSKDLYKLTFYGNKQFEGTTADISDFNFNLIQFQQFQVGVSKKINKGEATYGAGLSLLNGQNYHSLHAPKALLYTAPGGDYIDFNSDIIYRLSDTTAKKFGTSNGIGTGLDLYADIAYKTEKNHKEHIIIEVKDMGMIWWGKKSFIMDRDTVFRFDGIRVNNIFNIQNQYFSNTNKDSIINNLTPLKRKFFSSTLPTTFNFYTISIFGKLQLVKGFRYIFNANSKLNLFVNSNYFFSKHISASLGVSYGGYSKFNVYCGVGVNVGKGFVFNAYSNNIEGFILPKKALAQGLYVSLLKFF